MNLFSYALSLGWKTLKSRMIDNYTLSKRTSRSWGSDSCLRLFCLDYLTKRAVLAVHLCKVVLVHVQIGLLRHCNATVA